MIYKENYPGQYLNAVTNNYQYAYNSSVQGTLFDMMKYCTVIIPSSEKVKFSADPKTEETDT